MSEMVCQRCETPLRLSEYTLCVPCTRYVWQDVWPGVRDMINDTLPVAERTALANVVAWVTGLLPELPAEIHATVADMISVPGRWWRKVPVGGFASPTPLRHQVKAATDIWRAWTVCQKELKRLSDTLSPSKQIAGLMWGAVAVRRLVRRYIRRRFQFDIRRQCFVRGSAALQLTHDVDTMICALQRYIQCERELQAGLAALWRASREGKEPTKGMQDAVEAMLISRQSALLLDRPLLGSPFVHHQELGAVSLAGRAATQLSVNKSPRLRQALEHDASPSAQSAFSALLEQLPGAVHLAHNAASPNEPLDKFLTRIAHTLER